MKVNLVCPDYFKKDPEEVFWLECKYQKAIIEDHMLKASAFLQRLRYLSWCRRRDLNPHPVKDTPLKRTCLPVPPLRHNYKVIGIPTRTII